MRHTALAVALLVGMHQPALAESFRFIALGDMPYGAPEKVYGPFERLIETINARKPELVVHTGDIKSGSTPCTDELLRDQLKFLQRFSAPLLYTPGDNEWTDCHREKAGRFDPLERLAFLRREFFADPTKTLGQTARPVESQAVLMAEGFAGFPENQRLVHKGVMFVTLHVVGSNNNFETRSPEAVAEFFKREEAVLAWLTDSFQKAKAQAVQAVVLVLQADMFTSGFDAEKKRFELHSGFARIGPAIAKEAREFNRPVLLIYGDSHIFLVHRPFPQSAPNLVALQVFGDQDMHAVEVEVDTTDLAVFAFRPVYNPALAAAPQG